ncbi:MULTISPECIES: PD-(D/E)XK motif protein [unclassified Streptomyces]|uniref:PD-(D/E)XK motif protein n=1 Tax=unclassified Streptomyces TaxID=2593676 RepID=UPI002E11507C|nr:PD-(D/E)XK motif protein [Streptomyces sp. NBC_01186]WSS42351.1 PD-(D/E)XK motif protein [Streptomyces sp. NBC_01187]
MKGAFRAAVEDRWRDLADAPSSSSNRLRTAPLPVSTPNGPPLAAVDHEGHRHLLVPIASNQQVRRGMDGPVLVLRKRPLEDAETYQSYADLGCLRHDLDDVFTGLCEDVLEEFEGLGPGHTSPAPAATVTTKALYRVLDRWRALFQTTGAPLGPQQLGSLFGELTVLLRLLKNDPSAHRLWTGPSGNRHDFTTGVDAIEVKTCTAGNALRVRVHGLRQLEPPESGSLHLACFRLERAVETPAGRSVVDMVERALDLCDDESALLCLLANAGYRTADAERYRQVRFGVADERWYAVEEGFPRLTSAALAEAHVPVTVTEVEYTVDLALEPPHALSRTRVERYLEAMLEGGV